MVIGPKSGKTISCVPEVYAKGAGLRHDVYATCFPTTIDGSSQKSQWEVNAVSTVVNDCSCSQSSVGQDDGKKALSVNWKNRSATKAVRRDKDVVPLNGIYRHREAIVVLQLWALGDWTGMLHIGHVVTRLARSMRTRHSFHEVRLLSYIISFGACTTTHCPLTFGSQ